MGIPKNAAQDSARAIDRSGPKPLLFQMIHPRFDYCRFDTGQLVLAEMGQYPVPELVLVIGCRRGSDMVRLDRSDPPNRKLLEFVFAGRYEFVGLSLDIQLPLQRSCLYFCWCGACSEFPVTVGVLPDRHLNLVNRLAAGVSESKDGTKW